MSRFDLTSTKTSNADQNRHQDENLYPSVTGKSLGFVERVRFASGFFSSCVIKDTNCEADDCETSECCKPVITELARREQQNDHRYANAHQHRPWGRSKWAIEITSVRLALDALLRFQ